MSDTKKLDRLLRELDKTTAEVLRQTFEDLTKENARLKERIDQLEKNVTAFAGQLESWGFDAAAKQIRSEIGVGRCSWCMGKDGKHEPDCEANNWLMSSPNKTQEVEE